MTSQKRANIEHLQGLRKVKQRAKISEFYKIGPLVLVAIVGLLAFSSAHARVKDRRVAAELPTEKTEPAPDTGKAHAAKYFKKKRAVVASRDHFMTLHFGSFTEGEAFHWGTTPKEVDRGRLNLAVTYRMGEWTNSADYLMRIDLNTFEFVDGKPTKLAIMPTVTFPDASSAFPLYFGAGAGVGVFFKQLPDESNLSLDYTIFTGIRLFDVFESTGFNFEYGMKNHVHLLSDGQFNGIYMAIGTVFSF